MTQENAHIHERTCIGCGQKVSKAGLLRIVRTGEGIAFDATGKAAGRGAYVCSPACFEKVRTGRLAHALERILDISPWDRCGETNFRKVRP